MIHKHPLEKNKKNTSKSVGSGFPKATTNPISSQIVCFLGRYQQPTIVAIELMKDIMIGPIPYHLHPWHRHHHHHFEVAGCVGRSSIKNTKYIGRMSFYSSLKQTRQIHFW